MKNYALIVETEPSPADIAILREHSPRLPEETERIELGVFVRDARSDLLGGVCGWVGSGWAYVDTLWLDESLRGQHYGTRLMDAFEQWALQQGVSRCFLGTTSFQARPFYEQRGYQVFLTFDDFVNGHTQYFLVNASLTTKVIDPALTLESPPERADVEALTSRLAAFNAPYIGSVRVGDLAVVVREGGRLVGGLAGFRFAHTFSLEQYWFDPPLREQGCDAEAIAAFGDALLAGSDFQQIDLRVMGGDALAAFQAAGYHLKGVHEDFPTGSATYYLEKEVQ